MKKPKSSISKLLILFSCCLILAACSLAQAMALKDCKYSYNKMTDVTFLGMTSSDILSLTGPAKLAVGLLGKAEAPLDFTVHINVFNPNNTTAAMESLYYKVSLDSVQVAEGSTSEPFMVVGGTTADLPLRLSVDMKDLIKSDKRPVVTRAIKNMLGVGTEPTNVTVQLRPTFKMGASVVTSPVFIPVSFAYSGKKNANQQPAN